MEKLRFPFVMKITTEHDSGKKRSISHKQVKLGSLLFNLLILLVFTGSFAAINYTVLYARFFLAKHQTELLSTNIKKLDSKEDSLNNVIDSLFSVQNRIRLKYGLLTIDSATQLLGVGGRPSLSQIADMELSPNEVNRVNDIYKGVNSIKRRADLFYSTKNELISVAVKKSGELVSTPTLRPVSGRISSPYGRRYHPILHRYAFHDGIDIVNKEWTPIKVTADGVITFAGIKSGYGNVIIVDHQGTKYSTRYAHLNGFNVRVGQVVKRGDVIGYLGNTGRSTGPHLHYEVRISGKTVNPYNYFLDKVAIID